MSLDSQKHIQQQQQGPPRSRGNGEIPSLKSLCFYVACTHFETNTFFYSLPPDLKRNLVQRFESERIFSGIHHLDFSSKPPDKLDAERQLSDDDLKAIAKLPNLQSLVINHCTALTPLALSHIGKMPNLTKLCMSGCRDAIFGLYFIKDLRNTLTHLDLSFCEVTDPLMPFVGKLRNLTTLNLMCNGIGDEGCAHIAHLARLEDLNLAMNPSLTDVAIQSLLGLNNLKRLNLSFCTSLKSREITQKLSNLPHLSTLELVGCDSVMQQNPNPKPLILLAEDSALQERLITRVLNRYDFEVDVAKNGEIAFEKYQANSNKYALILMDVYMPVMDGISCVKKIRDFEKAQHKEYPTPIIIQTGSLENVKDQTLLKEYNCELLKKPLDKACIMLAKRLMQHKSERKQSSTTFPPRKSLEAVIQPPKPIDNSIVTNSTRKSFENPNQGIEEPQEKRRKL